MPGGEGRQRLESPVFRAGVKRLLEQLAQMPDVEVQRTTSGSIVVMVRQLATDVALSSRHREVTAFIEGSLQGLTVQELREAEAALRSHLPQTPEQIEEIGQLAEDPERRKLAERITGTLSKADLSKVPLALIPLVVYIGLCQAFALPLNGEGLHPPRSGDYLVVLTIVLMVWVYLFPRSK